MAGSMMQRFVDNAFEPIDYEGRTVHPQVSFDVATGDELHIEWVSAASPRPQGLSLRLRDPQLRGAKGRAGQDRGPNLAGDADLDGHGPGPRAGEDDEGEERRSAVHL